MIQVKTYTNIFCNWNLHKYMLWNIHLNIISHIELINYTSSFFGFMEFYYSAYFIMITHIPQSVDIKLETKQI